jgi:hypothetical protein
MIDRYGSILARNRTVGFILGIGLRSRERAGIILLTGSQLKQGGERQHLSPPCELSRSRGNS